MVPSTYSLPSVLFPLVLDQNFVHVYSLSLTNLSNRILKVGTLRICILYARHRMTSDPLRTMETLWGREGIVPARS
jgi:hypothetical protein